MKVMLGLLALIGLAYLAVYTFVYLLFEGLAL